MAAPLIPLALSLAQFAPSVMRFFGAGQASVSVAQKVVGIAQTITGQAAPEAAIDALRADPQLALQFQLAVIAADAELEQAYLADRQGARERDIELRKITGGSNTRADVMIAGAIIGLVACLFVLTVFRGDDVPGEVTGIVTTIASIFGLCLRDAFQFEFGSSRGSKEKDQALIKWADES